MILDSMEKMIMYMPIMVIAFIDDIRGSSGDFMQGIAVSFFGMWEIVAAASFVLSLYVCWSTRYVIQNNSSGTYRHISIWGRLAPRGLIMGYIYPNKNMGLMVLHRGIRAYTVFLSV